MDDDLANGASAGAWLTWLDDLLDATGVGLRAALAGVAALGALLGAFWWLSRQAPPPVEATLPLVDVASVSTTTLPEADVVVHVAGAVLQSGVHRLPAGSRVVDAVQACGGLADDADTDRINLAAVLVDGSQIYVPRVGETVPVAVAVAASEESSASGVLDLNRADPGDLETLPGIGPATARAIVDHRERHGPFQSVEGLLAVRGIGEAKLAAIRYLVRV